ncbi:MAG: sigma-70 family RNA polymerase sigma factor, partial [Actinomycetes bacterium]
PQVLAGLVQRGEDFDAAEDALQEALVEALRVWPEHPPQDPRAWLSTVATRRLIDARRSDAARRGREDTRREQPEPQAPTTETGDDTLFLLFCCCHPDLAPASQVALTLRAVGGLTTREIADAFYVPEATMAQRISRARRSLRGRRLDSPGDLAVVLRVLYLVYTTGHAGRVDLAAEAIRLARQLTLATEEPEALGLLALMLLNHARLPARFDSEGRIVTLDRQDRGLWDTREIAEGVRVLQSALAARHRREEATYAEPRPAATEEGDDTLFLLFCCCHPDLAPASQVALTLRAVGGLTTREIADAFYVPEATMAQRISRAKRALQGRRLDRPGDLAVVLRV